jgi:hypothetical protein
VHQFGDRIARWDCPAVAPRLAPSSTHEDHAALSEGRCPDAQDVGLKHLVDEVEVPRLRKEHGNES